MKATSTYLSAAVLVACLSLAGCDSSGADGPGMDAMVSQMEQSKRAAQEAAEAQARAEAEAKAAEEAARAAEAAAAAQAAQAAAPPQPENETTITITVKNPGGLLGGGPTTAGAGTVGQGGSYADAIIAARRHITTRVDDLAWTQAVQHYWAETGHYPRSHDEFMTEVIAKYDIPLEPLEQDQEYLYAPPGSELSEGQFGTLYIVTRPPPEQSPPPAEESAPAEPAPPPAE